jgi:hypothetical protein
MVEAVDVTVPGPECLLFRLRNDKAHRRRARDDFLLTPLFPAPT